MIITSPDILNGKPHIEGTRIAAAYVQKLLIMGWSDELILENFTRLTKENLEEVKAYYATN